MQGHARRRGLVRPAARREAPAPVQTGPPAQVLDTRAMLELQRTAGNTSARALAAPAGGSVRGQPLDDSTRAFMERRFGHDFGRVRLHTDEAATASARALDAHAFTAGDHVVFQRSLYNPHSTAGRRMLAHELAHVIEQRGGPPGRLGPGGIEVTEHGDASERRADRVAREVAGPHAGKAS
jgi:Domain of unknown function (DUF4157)